MTGTESLAWHGRANVAPSKAISVLLVEDDDGDAYLVRELLADTPLIRITWVRSVAEALKQLDGYDCILLDLGLPDTIGLDGLRRLRRAADHTPVVVLTGLDDETQAVAAVSAGAQDYLLKGQVTDRGLMRTVQYAILRRDAEEMEAQLRQEQMYAQENTRLERGLLPQPLISSPDVTVTARYRPGGGRMLLGGDFYDVVEDASGTVHAMIGDVTGHGPDQAAVGVALRIAWRTLVLAGRPVEETLKLLDRVLVHERHDEDVFATVFMISIAPDRTSADAYTAGHPAPLLHAHGQWAEVSLTDGPSLGLLPSPVWRRTRLDLRGSDRLLLFTDGAIEGRTSASSDRLEMGGLRRIFNGMPSLSQIPGEAGDAASLDQVISEITQLNGGPLTDDLALLMLTYADVT
jgi:serine phosphatase RsbU (regulator of sigma subunit)